MHFYRSILHHKQFRYLGAFYIHSIIMLFSVAIFQIFNGIYIYQTFADTGFKMYQALAFCSLIFSLMYLVQALAVPVAIWLIAKKGLRFSVFWGNACLIIFYILLFLAKFDPIFLILASIFGGLNLGLYWTAHHAYFVELTDDKKQGEEISINNALAAVVAIGAPAFGGLVIAYFGYEILFLIIIILMILAMLPLKYLPKQEDKIPISIIATVKALSPKKEFRSYLALLGEGTIQVTSVLFWPLYALPFLAGLVGLGFVGSLVALFASLTTVACGLLIDKLGPKKMLNFFAPFDSLTGLLRAFVISSGHVFLVSIFSGVTNEGQFISLDSMIYERARHVDIIAFISQREVGLALGRFIFLLILGILFWFGLPLAMVFVITALLALSTKLYPSNK